jgi:hypothetical protein
MNVFKLILLIAAVMFPWSGVSAKITAEDEAKLAKELNWKFFEEKYEADQENQKKQTYDQFKWRVTEFFLGEYDGDKLKTEGWLSRINPALSKVKEEKKKDTRTALINVGGWVASEYSKAPTVRKLDLSKLISYVMAYELAKAGETGDGKALVAYSEKVIKEVKALQEPKVAK